MGRSFKRDNYVENVGREKSREFKRRKNKEKESHMRDEMSEYKIHGYKKEKD